jgi:hypothetical protein
VSWLTVQGTSAWRCGENRYEPGQYEVDEETAERARASGIPRLIVSDSPPDLRSRPEGALRPEDMLDRGGVEIAGAPEPVQEEGLPDPVPSEFPCEFCPEGFPSSGARARHVEFHHTTDG